MTPCRICNGLTSSIGSKQGKYIAKTFNFLRCNECGFAFVENPIVDYSLIYNDDYYAGRGADPLVDYEFELRHPKMTIRTLEWEGIFAWGNHELGGNAKRARWLDFGAGAGGLVRFLKEKGVDAVGLDVGSFVQKAQSSGIPIYEPSDMQKFEAFDIVSMIEVLEHAIDPIDLLKTAAKLLKPGGKLILTTGNSDPFRDDILGWSYVTPEIHVSYFNPRALSLALSQAGVEPRSGRYQPGWDKIIAFKVLKNIRLRQINPIFRLAPWGVLSRIVDRRYQLSRHPLGIKNGAPSL